MGESDPRDSDIATHATITHPDGRQAGNARRTPDGTAEERDLVGRRLRQFRVVERLGAGGMGVVYKAIDEKLDRPVALKVLASRYLVEDSSCGRLLLQEARSAAAVAHRNVATIHEVNESEDVSFIAMELIDGETLRARIAAGPLPLDEVCHHAREIAAGLACAHATGIVHRDLKPDNAMVTADGHIKLLDFGLARAQELASTESSQRVAGTPAYMSPEQARGEPGDARSDVFALGATLFELRTGAPPFDRASARPSEWRAPRDWTPRELPRRSGARGLDVIILRCLAYRPEDRYADGGDVAKALDVLATRGARPSIARRVIGALVAAAAVGSVVAYLWRPRASAASPQAVAFVVPTDGVPQDQQWIATVAERRAVAELTASGRIHVFDAARTGDHPSAHQFADPSPVVAARQLAADLDVDRSVVLQANGSALGELTMIATIYDATGDRVATMQVAGRSQDTIALAAQLAAEIREQLGVAPAESLDSARMALPATAEAARRYAEGLALRRTFDIAGARRAFEAARDLDPDSPLVHAALAELWTYMGYEERAAAENRRAIELAAPLRREDRLRLEARSAVLAHAWDRAIDAYRALSLLIPEELDDALAIVETMIDAGRVDDAATTIEEVARRPGGVSDPRVTVLRARIASLRGNRALARDTARAARAGALANGRTALVTAADAVICADAAQSGEPAEAEAACRRALTAYQNLGDAIGEAQLVAVFARNLLELGRKADARALVENTEPRVRRVGASRGLVRLLRAIANIEQKSSNNARALVVAGEAASIARALANPDVLGPALGQLASAELEAGHIDNARSHYTEAIAVAKAAGYWARAAQHLQNLALLHLREGRCAEGLPYIEESLSLFHRVHESYDIAWALDTAGLIALNMNELDKAQAFVEEGIAVRLKNHLIGGQSRQNLADVLLAKGNNARALAEAQRAVDEFHRNADHGEVFALEVLSRAQLASNDPKAALATADHAFASEDPSRRKYLQQMLVPTRARARYALGERAAIPELAQIVASGPTGPDGFAFRLALGELIARDGDPRHGRALLSALVTEAHKAGDELTTAQANQLLATLPR